MHSQLTKTGISLALLRPKITITYYTINVICYSVNGDTLPHSKMQKLAPKVQKCLRALSYLFNNIWIGYQLCTWI